MDRVLTPSRLSVLGSWQETYLDAVVERDAERDLVGVKDGAFVPVRDLLPVRERLCDGAGVRVEERLRDIVLQDLFFESHELAISERVIIHGARANHCYCALEHT